MSNLKQKFCTQVEVRVITATRQNGRTDIFHDRHFGLVAHSLGHVARVIRRISGILREFLPADRPTAVAAEKRRLRSGGRKAECIEGRKEAGVEIGFCCFSSSSPSFKAKWPRSVGLLRRKGRTEGGSQSQVQRFGQRINREFKGGAVGVSKHGRKKRRGVRIPCSHSPRGLAYGYGSAANATLNHLG